MCLILRLDPLRLIIPSTAGESQHRICCDASVSSSSVFSNCRNRFHLSQSAATNSASPLLSAIVDCILLDAMIGYQPSLPRSHDAAPLTLNRSASPAQSESPYVNTSSFYSFQVECRRPYCHDSRVSTEVSQGCFDVFHVRVARTSKA